ncbi:MAG: hypothetical protein AMK73_07770 [Planctomycetes bacterium SM23_32]|nr:MAG: hypothetical protein AMK73_07770 [Planctomycetes bacterium SM23_32]
MGFFSDKCPSCGGKVRRGASFCPHCGEQAPRARAVCPSCGATLKGGAKFCGKCGAPIRPGPEGEVAVDEMNRWRRAEGEFARRIEAQDLRGLLSRGLVVEPGTRALIFQGGSLAGTAEPGTYDMNRKLGKVDAAAPATAILMDAGDVTLQLGYQGLRTEEDVAVNAAAQAVVRLGKPEALYTNLMHGRQRLTESELADFLGAEGANLVQARIKGASVKDLAGNLELRQQMEEGLRAGIGDMLAENGLELVRLRFLDFYGDAYEQVRQARGKTFVKEELAAEDERRAALYRRIRSTLTRDQMDKFASAKDLEEFIRQREHEMGMKDVIREGEMEELKRTYEETREDAEVTRRHLLEKLEAEHGIEVARTKAEGRGEILEEELKQREAIFQAGMGETKRKMDFALEARAGKQELDLEKTRAEQAISEQARDAEARRELERLEAMGNLSEEQILAIAAAESPEAARAVVERYRAQAAGNEKVQQIYEDMLDRIERMARDAMRAQADAAAGAGGRARALRCPNCNGSVEPGSRFCEHCGGRLSD